MTGQNANAEKFYPRIKIFGGTIWIKWKERQERRLKLEAPKTVTVVSAFF